MYLDKDAILNSLTIEDVIAIVQSLGSAEPKKDSNGNIIFQTICHNEPNQANSYKLYYYHESSDKYQGRTFHCYSGCSESFGIVELVIRANRVQGKTITWYKALKYIGTITNKLTTLNAEQIEHKREIIDDFTWINRIKAVQKKHKNTPTLKEINENILEIFTYIPHESWLTDNCSREALSRFEIGYYGLTNQITIPHRDKNGRLIGIRGRFLDEKDIKQVGKYVPLQINNEFLKHQLGNNLYGLHITKDRIKRIKKIMIVEAEKSCIQAYSYFKDDSFVVAICGSNITPTQVKIILGLGVEEVMFAPDRDYHGAQSFEAEIWFNKQVKKIAPFVPYCKTYLIADSKNRLEYKDSPTDKGKDILLELMKEKIIITIEDVRRLENK